MKLALLLFAAAVLAEGADAPGFDCSAAKDPKACEARVAKMREAREKARQTCEGKRGAEQRACMVKAFCAEAQDPAKCQTTLQERFERRARVRAACKDKQGDALQACVREHE